jgi:8-oxo-dGTP diphosphatase
MLSLVGTVLVVAGVIERNGSVFICQRKAGARHALKWEFPGGKVEPGETPRQALARELDEELGIRATVGAEIGRYEYRYANRSPMLLIFFSVSEFEGEPENREFEEIRWEERARLPGYDFLEGDLDFVRRLARERSD